VLLDAGPLVAFLNRDDEWHNWAVAQFKRFPQFITCEAVLAEACARLAYYRREQSKVIELILNSAVVVDFEIEQSADRILRLMKKYADQPMDFADACLVAMSERTSDSVVVTLDETDFSVYRRHEREIVPLITPKQR